MDENDRSKVIRRILVALDASPHSLAALEAAAELAAVLDAELVGVFVEDINLVRFAELPFAGEVGRFSAQIRRLDARHIARQFRAQARSARRALARRAEMARLRWSFQVARGAITSELLAAALNADLIILGKSGWSEFKRFGSTAREVVVAAPQPTMVLGKELRLGFSAVVIYDGSPETEQAMLTAGYLVRGREGVLTVLILAEGAETAERLQEQVTPWAAERNIPVRFHWLRETDPRKICDLVEAYQAGVLIIPRESAALPEPALMVILESVDCPVLTVR